jgi:hypothetical protein
MSWTAGTTYYILLDDESTISGNHTFYINCPSVADPCSSVTTINGCGSSYSQTYTGGGTGTWFNSSATDCGYYAPGIEKIYKFVPSSTGTYSIQVTSANGYVNYLWKASTCSSSGWTCIGRIASTGTYGSISCTAGTTYYILLDDENSTTGSHTFYIKSVLNQPSDISGPSTACLGSSNNSYSVTAVAGITYTWSYSGSGSTISSGQGTNSIKISYSSTATSGTLTVTPSNYCATGTPKTLSISLSGQSSVGSITGVDSLCVGNSFAFSANAINLAGGTGSWSSSNTSIATVTSSGSVTAKSGGTCNIVYAITGGCSTASSSKSLIVIPSGQVNQPSNQVIINGNNTTAITFSTTNTVGLTTYSWTNSAPSIGLSATGSGNIPSFKVINTGTSPVVATIVVTPIYIAPTMSCSGTPKTFTITVNPTAQVKQPINQIICNGTNVASVNFETINTGGTTTYSWTNKKTSIGLSASGIGNIATFVGINTGTTPIIDTITVTPTYTNGAVSGQGSSKIFTITINPNGQVNQPSNQITCDGNNTISVNFGTINSGGTTTYSWTTNIATIGLAATGTGNIASFKALNKGDNQVVASINVTPTYKYDTVRCQGQQVAFSISINPAPVIALKWNDVLVCSNYFGLYSGYQWIMNNSLIQGATRQYYLSNKKAGSYKVETTDKSGCISKSDSISVADSKVLSLYPNPATSYFAADLSDDPVGETYINIYNESGSLVKELKTKKTRLRLYEEIPVNDLEGGLYFVWISVNKVNQYYSRIVVIK